MTNGEGGVQSYIRWLVPRLRECWRLLAPTGSFFLHLDERSVHYAKIELDKIFGENNFVNEIVWKRTSSNNASKNKLSVITDYILFYAKDKEKMKFKKLYAGHSESYKKSHYSKKDKDGRHYQLTDLNSPNFNKNTQYTYKGYKPNSKGWRWSLQKMKDMDKKGYVFFPEDKNKRLRQIRYLDEQKGTPISNLWSDIFPVNSMAKERIGYPTQKPLNLLNRVLEITTDKNDMVFDAFSGCGTTISSAQNLGRQWLGIDISKDAISVIRKRMAKEHSLKIQVIKVGTLSRAEVYRLNPFEFEHQMVKMIGGTPNLKKVGDGGIDGFCYDHTPIQVKKSFNVGRPVIDSFYKHVKKGNGRGVIIARSFSSGAFEEVNKLFNEEGLLIDLVPSDDIIRDAS